MGIRTDNFIWKTICKWYLRNRKSMQKCPSISGLTGDISFYCRVLHVSRQGFYQYLAKKDHPWKYQPLAEAMMEILEEDDWNNTYGRIGSVK